MPRILFVTVGGSPQPIVTSINSLTPDRVIFICSKGNKGSETQVTGEGKPCEIRKGDEVEKLPNIPTQCKLQDRFVAERDLVLLDNPDDLSEVYTKITSKIREISSGDLLADYTGGTKTMSVALTIAALDNNMTVHLTTSTNRDDLIRVKQGQRVRRASVISITLNRVIEQALPSLLSQYNYPGAYSQLERLLLDFELQPQDRQRIEKISDLCQGLDLWDRFDHANAYYYLKPYLSDPKLKPLVLFLKQVMGSRQDFAEDFQAADATRGHGYEIVEDLLFNAERRASLGRYDDAVGRLYRALELLAQIQLQKVYTIRTGDVDLTKLPESIRDNYQKQLGLMQSYQLLADLPNDPLGIWFQKHKSPIQDKLKVRNFSLMAHGLKPITEEEYQGLAEVVLPFLQGGIKQIIAPKKLQGVQFPNYLNTII